MRSPARLAWKALVGLALILPFAASGVALAQGDQLPPSSVQGAAKSDSKMKATAEPLVPAANPWMPATAYPIAITDYAFAQVAQDSYVISGKTSGPAVVNTVRRYNATTNIWMCLTNNYGSMRS